MVDSIHINKINNGYLISESWIKQNNLTHYFKDLPEVIEHLDICFGANTPEEMLNKIREKAKKQVRT